MSLTLLSAPAPRSGALVAPQFDDRPCVVNPPQWWDVGDDGNNTAMWLCRTACPKNDDTCEISEGVIRRGQAWGAKLRPLAICDTCQHPRTRVDEERKNVACKCRRNPIRTNEQAIQEWAAADGENRSIGEVAAEIGMTYAALRDALRRARRAGDPRVTPKASRRVAA